MCKIIPDASIAQPCGTSKITFLPCSFACLICSMPINSLRCCKCFFERTAISPIPNITCANTTNISSITCSRCCSDHCGKQYCKLICARLRCFFALCPTNRPILAANLSRKRKGINASNSKTKIPSQMPQYLGFK